MPFFKNGKTDYTNLDITPYWVTWMTLSPFDKIQYNKSHLIIEEDGKGVATACGKIVHERAGQWFENESATIKPRCKQCTKASRIMDEQEVRIRKD